VERPVLYVVTSGATPAPTKSSRAVASWIKGLGLHRTGVRSRLALVPDATPTDGQYHWVPHPMVSINLGEIFASIGRVQ
jgi:hypothetical protein